MVFFIYVWPGKFYSANDRKMSSIKDMLLHLRYHDSFFAKQHLPCPTNEIVVTDCSYLEN